MTTWVRYQHQGAAAFGTLTQEKISEFEGEMFGDCVASGVEHDLENVTLEIPCVPSKILALWNNFNATAEKTGLPLPAHPWYFVMTPNTYAATNTIIKKPSACSGKIAFEGELGIVIGKPCKEVALEDVGDHIFGYTCVNDVTAPEFLVSEEDFAHWTRAKCFDGFGVFGPGITTGICPDDLAIKTYLENGETVQERQNYPVSDMIFSPHEIVARISHDMTLNAGDIIACGTSIGAGAMKDGWNVRIVIDGVGVLENTYSET